MEENYSFTTNGVMRSTSEDKPLLHYLREDLHLHSVKDRCSGGVRSTRTTVVDGKAVKSYILTTKRVVGKNIITTEGLGDAEKEAFVYAFDVMGSVQCGFCTSDMVVIRKALIGRVSDPIEGEIKFVPKGSICCCIGYKKIIKGAQLTAVTLRGDTKTEEPLGKGDSYGVGERALRLGAKEKAPGYGERPGDVEMEGVAYVPVVRPRYPRTKVLDVNLQEVMALLGVLTVLAAEDTLDDKVGYPQQDRDVIIAKDGITRCVGDAIHLVVVETKDILEDAKKLVKIDYGELTSICSTHEATAEDAPKIHEKGNLCRSRYVIRGDAKKALKNSKYMMAQTHIAPFIEHGLLEPECVMTFSHKDGVKVRLPNQGVYDTRKKISIMLDWDPDRIVAENRLIGGGFGGKEGISTQHIAALAISKIQRSVKAVFSRQEPINFHPKCHAMEGTPTLGCDENGVLADLDCEVYFDTGACTPPYGSVLERACIHSVGPYCYQNTDTRGFGYCTNNPPAEAFRGLGVCRSEFALESNINLLAEKVDISPWEVRYRNAIKSGKVLPNGRTVDCLTTSKETLLAVKDAYESNQDRVGIVCAMRNTGMGVGFPDKGRAELKVHNGKVELYIVTSDIGRGCVAVFVQMVAEMTGLKKEQIKNMGVNSGVALDLGVTSGSRQVLVTGEAVRMATADALGALKKADSNMPQLEEREFFTEFFNPADKLGTDVPSPKSHTACGFAIHVVTLGDEGKVKEVYAAHDSDKVMNPISIQGQTEGDVFMGPDHALTEDFPLENGVSQTEYDTLGPMRSTQIPDIRAAYMERKEQLPLAYGAKGIGEIVTIPTVPAAQGAYYAMDHILRIKLLTENTFHKRRK